MGSMPIYADMDVPFSIHSELDLVRRVCVAKRLHSPVDVLLEMDLLYCLDMQLVVTGAPLKHTRMLMVHGDFHWGPFSLLC